MLKKIKHKGVKIALCVLAASLFLIIVSAIAVRVIINIYFSFDTGEIIYSIFYFAIFISIYTSAISILYLLFVFIKKIIKGESLN